MVQRYEQMRRLQWYKRGAAYYQIPHSVVETLAMDGWHLRKLAAEGYETVQLQR